jgi:hypothetical protein
MKIRGEQEFQFACANTYIFWHIIECNCNIEGLNSCLSLSLSLSIQIKFLIHMNININKYKRVHI